MKCLSKIEKILYTERTSTFLIVFSVIVFVSAIVIFIVFGSWHFSSVLDEAKVGTFGDFVGGVVGTLLAFVASILYYVALKKQQEELLQNQEALTLQTEALNRQIEEFKQQSEEMVLTREVYKLQNETMKEEERTMHLQQFDSHFFGFFQVYRDLKHKLNKENSDFFNELLVQIDQSIFFSNCKSYQSYSEEVRRVYETLFLENRNRLSSYYRCLYRLVRQVDECTFLSQKDKWRYVKLVRAQITDNELLVLYYNCCSEMAIKSRDLYYKYNLFKHLQPIQKIEFKAKNPMNSDDIIRIGLFSEWLLPNIESFNNKVCDEFLNGDIKEEHVCRDLQFVLKCYTQDDAIYIHCIFKDPTLFPSSIKDIVSDLLTDKLYRSKFDSGNEICSPHDLIDQDTKYRTLEYSFDGASIRKIQIDLD